MKLGSEQGIKPTDSKPGKINPKIEDAAKELDYLKDTVAEAKGMVTRFFEGGKSFTGYDNILSTSIEDMYEILEGWTNPDKENILRELNTFTEGVEETKKWRRNSVDKNHFGFLIEDASKNLRNSSTLEITQNCANDMEIESIKNDNLIEMVSTVFDVNRKGLNNLYTAISDTASRIQEGGLKETPPPVSDMLKKVGDLIDELNTSYDQRLSEMRKALKILGEAINNSGINLRSIENDL